MITLKPEDIEIPDPEILDAPESDYAALIEATEAATTVKGLREVLASYFAENTKSI